MFNFNQPIRVLVIPDSIWGNDSGHRSTQFLMKVLKNMGHTAAVYAEDVAQYNAQKINFSKQTGIKVFKKTPYRFKDQLPILNSTSKREFFNVLDTFRPDAIFYFGTIRNKVSIDYISEYDCKIPYYYLPLTNEFWCLKDFAGREKGECFYCINGNYIHSYKYNCLEGHGISHYLKKYFEGLNARQRMINAEKVLAYSKEQSKTISLFGVDSSKLSMTKIFFDKATVENIDISKGNYVAVVGQLSVAKGWHFVPNLIKNDKNEHIHFKLVIYNREKAKEFIKENSLEAYIESGKIEILSELDSHTDVLNVLANSFAVFIPSSYPSTGEFSLLESMGLSKPVLAFNVGAHRDFLINGLNSFVSEVGDFEDVSKNIQKLYADNDLWKKISSESKQTFEKLTNFESL